MTNMATLRFECTGHHSGITTLRLQSDRGPVNLPVQGQHVWVPYPLVRAMLSTHGWAISDPTAVWPPRRGLMCPPEALAPGDIVTLPDGTHIQIPAPFNQAVEFPERFIAYLESKGWHRLAQYA